MLTQLTVQLQWVITTNFSVFSSEHGAEEEQQYIEELLSYQIEGLIVLSHTLSSKLLSSYQIPIVAIEREAEYISSVTTDNYMGALQATTLLIRDKCDILIHINVNVEKAVPAYDRIRAFRKPVKISGSLWYWSKCKR